MGGHHRQHSAGGQEGLVHSGATAAMLASQSPAPSSSFVNNGAEKIAAKMPLCSSLCCPGASSPEVMVWRWHKGCWEGGKDWGGLGEASQGLLLPPGAGASGQRQALTPTVGTIMILHLGHAWCWGHHPSGIGPRGMCTLGTALGWTQNASGEWGSAARVVSGQVESRGKNHASLCRTALLPQGHAFQ